MLVLQRYKPLPDWDLGVTPTVTHRYKRYNP